MANIESEAPVTHVWYLKELLVPFLYRYILLLKRLKAMFICILVLFTNPGSYDSPVYKQLREEYEWRALEDEL